MTIQKLTILHSNDMHGDFLEEERDGVKTGGLARVCQYVKDCREKEDHVLYFNAGDMFRGSIIDSEYLGLSTIELMNVLQPDATCIGNHEVDYGIAHLLFLEKCARFPIVCANLFVTLNNTRLFRPYRNARTGPFKVLVIGILTEDVIASTRSEKVIGTFIDVDEAAREVGIICDNYRTTDTDITVLLTHIGIEEDRKLAERLNPGCGVDFIIGGHSHTYMEQPEIINGIPIVQAYTGTDQIGRFDIRYDDEEKQIVSWEWKTIPVNEHLCGEDPIMKELIGRYQNETDLKYRRVVTRFARKLTHPTRIQETELGNLYADMLQDDSSFDLMIIGSGSIRKEELGPIVEYQDMLENTPFDDALWMLEATGEQLKRMVLYILRDDAWLGHTEFYQYSKGMHIRYNRTTHELKEFTFHDKPIEPEDRITFAVQNYHYVNFDDFFGVPLEEIKKNRKARMVAISVNNIFEEYLSVHQGLDARVEGRIVIED
ncbi:MAG: 5'-nucleotidase C-terminal domain-containing protein [Solobacterium sp.]|nr:5'-nucleotidase C-terminal domain-containing protein [Solobacterium sp.]